MRLLPIAQDSLSKMMPARGGKKVEMESKTFEVSLKIQNNVFHLDLQGRCKWRQICFF
jgi:hypothetical protein